MAIRKAPPGPTHYGLFVGINDYQSLEINPLHSCVNDAVEMQEILTNEIHGIIKIKDATLMINEQAKKNEIIQFITDVVSKLKDDDAFTIYWSSHGTRPNDDRQELYLVAHDTSPRHSETFVKFIEELVPIFMKVKNHIMVIVDGCKVGDALARPIVTDNDHIGIMSATKREENALEDSRLKHGIFTYFLLQTLVAGDVDGDGDGYVSMEEAWSYTYRPVLNYVAQHFPEHSQHPTCVGNNIHHMKLIKQARVEELINPR